MGGREERREGGRESGLKIGGEGERAIAPSHPLTADYVVENYSVMYMYIDLACTCMRDSCIHPAYQLKTYQLHVWFFATVWQVLYVRY